MMSLYRTFPPHIYGPVPQNSIFRSTRPDNLPVLMGEINVRNVSSYVLNVAFGHRRDYMDNEQEKPLDA